ncbi:sulfurtransferase complex subunit TusB [Kangiella sp. TOML190]|uniref:sulfurtransferase complex subunit TusB n=1 Tax=Kangiella sp. TOML190 TaxID=2931351 RepID=UPI00203B9E93|nr:sulfurtransferase complex subunit TusB [Kangiella sp. TOML190]
MKSLYLLNNPDNFQACLPQLQAHDGLLLIENAVILATKITELPCKAMVLSPDLEARALTGKVQPNWQPIDYADFVNKTLNYDKCVSWL